MKYICENINNYNIDVLYTGVSKARIEKTDALKNPVVKLRSLAVEYELNKLIKKEYPDIKVPVDITYDKLGKPHIYTYNGCMVDITQSGDTVEKIFISLSHSGEYVAAMISDTPCGIDIEIIKDRSYEKIAKRICTESELTRIKNANDFYSVWTLKESALKASGLGLSYDMRLIDTENIIINEIKYAGAKLNAPAGYIMSFVEEQ